MDCGGAACPFYAGYFEDSLNTMRNTDYFKNKKVAIIGLGRSGLACANLLYDLGAEVSVTDNTDNELTRLNAAKLKSPQIKFELGRHSRQFIKDRELLVVSPGVPSQALPIIWAQDLEIPLISEIEVGGLLCPATIIAVTGTNGKTTVTTLIGKVLEGAGRRVSVCGNTGEPFCATLDKIKEDDFVCLEVSSFQLERIKNFKPKISVILNFTRNHLDRYKDTQEYLEAKKRIFINQNESNYLVLNYDDPIVRGLAKESKAKIIYFSKNKNLNSNQMAVLAVSSILGIDKESVMKIFREFRGIEHRLEHVAEIDGVRFINDSKSTTVDSTVWALNNLTSPIILIAGGRDKGNDYKGILELMQDKIKEVILIGETKDRLKEIFKPRLSVAGASTLEEAVNLSFKKANPGDCVLLSPMCASFDMFANYEERGNCFKKAVYTLIKDKGRS